MIDLSWPQAVVILAAFALVAWIWYLIAQSEGAPRMPPNEPTWTSVTENTTEPDEDGDIRTLVISGNKAFWVWACPCCAVAKGQTHDADCQKPGRAGVG